MLTKHCPKCNKTKSVNDFYMCGKKIRYICKVCQLIHDKEYYRRADRLNVYFKTKRGRAAWNKASKIASSKFKEKWSARAKLRNAVKKGLIKKETCWCGETKVHAHHAWGYKGDNIFRVQWLCIKHHVQVHL